MIRFTKMHGAGNDYVYLDCFRHPPPERPGELSRVIADRHKGVGGDGLILICPDEAADARMRMFNTDGSESEMCGNGIRCVAKYLYDHDICRKEHLAIATGAGILQLDLTADGTTASQVRVDMGAPILEAGKIPSVFDNSPVVNRKIQAGDREFECTCLSMGNPHCVIFTDELTDELVLHYGPMIENSRYFPARVNVEFVKILSRCEVRQRTWERGSGETLACGTGASAVCVAGVLTGRTERQITNHLLGGTLMLAWDESSGHVFKTGPATEVFSGVWNGTW